MSFSESELDLFQRNLQNAKESHRLKNIGHGQRAELQNGQVGIPDPDQGKPSLPRLSPAPHTANGRHRQGSQNLHGRSGFRFRIAVALAVSPGHAPDPDGSMSTILDSLLKAVHLLADESPAAAEWCIENCPLNDNAKNFPIEIVTTNFCNPGREGATVTLQRMTEPEIVDYMHKLETL
jgi:hypothetical protein